MLFGVLEFGVLLGGILVWRFKKATAAWFGGGGRVGFFIYTPNASMNFVFSAILPSISNVTLK